MIPRPKKFSEEEKEEVKKIHPPFVAKKILELNQHPEINDQIPTHIDDFYRLHLAIWKISNKSYQEEFWGKQGQWGDNYMETMETFLGDAEGVLEANNPPDDPPIEMTQKQREILQKLYDRVDFFTRDPETPGSDYGENDDAIINDPKWQKISEYARLVYEELSGDDLDEWEKSRTSGE